MKVEKCHFSCILPWLYYLIYILITFKMLFSPCKDFSVMSGSPRWTAQKRACTVAPHPFCHWEPGGNVLPDRYVRQMCNLCDCRYYMRARSRFRRKMSSGPAPLIGWFYLVLVRNSWRPRGGSIGWSWVGMTCDCTGWALCMAWCLAETHSYSKGAMGHGEDVGLFCSRMSSGQYPHAIMAVFPCQHGGQPVTPWWWPHDTW